MNLVERSASSTGSAYDVVVIGAGFSGLNALHVLRERFKVRVFEAGDGVGGTWYWNRYPGARCDVESLDYCYTFSHELYRDWNWSERYATQPEIERYANWVADRFDLRRDIQFSTRVTSAVFDEDANLWTVKTDRGDVVTARWVIAATGCLSAPNKPPFKGIDSFEGEIYQTSLWPKEPIDFTGKRVAVIGTGSSGIQAIPQIAEQALHLTVFQRTANYSIPARQGLPSSEYVAARKDETNLKDWRARAMVAPQGLPTQLMALKDLPPEEAQSELERRWALGGLSEILAPFYLIGSSHEENKIHADFVRSKIREIVKDPKTAELLCPNDHPYTAKRPCVDTGYFETFNRDNVSLVSVRNNPIAEVTPNSLRLQNGEEFKIDILVMATGFDAMTGALTRMDIRGRNGVSLKDAWANGPRTYLGLQTAGFPNFFIFVGPGSPSVLSNMILGMEYHARYINDCLCHLRDRGIETIEASPEAEEAWVVHMEEIANATIYNDTASWWRGANVEGKPQGFMIYLGGWPAYTQKCAESAENGYAGFILDGSADRSTRTASAASALFP